MTDEARTLAKLAGGAAAMAREALQVLPTNPRLAGNLADWAFYAEPGNAEVLRAGLEVYLARLHASPPLMEATVYLDHAAELSARLQASQKAAEKVGEKSGEKVPAAAKP